MEKRKTINWLPTDNRFVAFIDILGFKDLVMRNSHSEIYRLLNEISKLRKLIENWEDTNDGRYINSEMYTVSFSDSIVIFSKSDSIEDFDLFIYSVKWLIQGAIERSIPLKGALAYGKISLNKSSQIYFGQPIIDAYLLEEEVNYFGVVAHHSIEKYYVDNIEKSSSKDLLFETQTPLKYGKISHLNLLWFHHKEVNVKNLKNTIKKLQYNISGNPRRYVDKTLEFIDGIYNSIKIKPKSK